MQNHSQQQDIIIPNSRDTNLLIEWKAIRFHIYGSLNNSNLSLNG